MTRSVKALVVTFVGLTTLPGLAQPVAQPAAAPPSFEAAVAMLRQVTGEGQGNAAATAAWPVVAGAGVDSLPRLLAAMDGAGPLAVNWLRAAVDAVCDDGEPLPLAGLEAFLADTRHDPRPRRLAYDLLRGVDPDRAAVLLDGMLEDPSVELRRDAVAALVARAEAAAGAGRAEEALAGLQRAFAAARDVGQVQAIAKSLEKAGMPVDLARHFGFVLEWRVIGPFDNPGGKGYATAYPPEQGGDPKAPPAVPVAGKFGPVEWRPVTSSDPLGLVDINGVYPPPAAAAVPAAGTTPSAGESKEGLKEVVAYAVAEFDAPQAADVELRLGTKNAWKVWLNGSYVFGRDEYHRGMEVDQYRLAVRLVPGRNVILVKLCQDDQRKPWTTEWEFQLRVCDRIGTAVLATGR
ncbi:MAG: hypothetical protein EBR86_16730 [Planctomycetia bacterium]|nr:hypothetical protein [Planctomycetia bacterium]